MRPVLVLGYGNPLRGDDAAGARAAEALAERWPADAVRVRAAHQLLVESAADLAEAGFAVFLDARHGPAPGTVRASALAPASDRRPASHYATPDDLLALTLSLYGRAPQAALVTVDGSDFGHGERLSPPVAAAMSVLIERTAGLVDAWLSAAAPKEAAPRPREAARA